MDTHQTTTPQAPRTGPALRGSALLGYLLGALAAASYGTNPLFAVPLYHAGLNTDTVLFFRYVFAIPMIAAMLWARGRTTRMSMPSLRRDATGWHFDLGEAGMAVVVGALMPFSSYALFVSYNHMDAGIASTLLFVYPIIVAVIMSLAYHEKAGWHTYVAILLVSMGVALLSGDSTGFTLSVVGTVWVFLSSLSYALYIIGVKQSRLRGVATLAITFYVVVIGTLMFGAKGAVSGTLMMPHGAWQWLSLVMLAFLPTTLSFICTTQAISMIGSTPTAILGALEPVTAVVIGACVLGEVVTPRTLTGLVVIIAAVTLVIVGGRLGSHMTHFRRLFPSLRKRRA